MHRSALFSPSSFSPSSAVINNHKATTPPPPKKLNNLRVVGKAPRAALTRLQIHKATGKKDANPRAGRCRCIFVGRLREPGEGGTGLSWEEATVEVAEEAEEVVATPSPSVSLASLLRTDGEDGEEPGCFGPPLPLSPPSLSLCALSLSLSLPSPVFLSSSLSLQCQ